MKEVGLQDISFMHSAAASIEEYVTRKTFEFSRISFPAAAPVKLSKTTRMEIFNSELFAMGPVQFSWPRRVAENLFTKPGFWEHVVDFFPGKTAKHRVH